MLQFQELPGENSLNALRSALAGSGIGQQGVAELDELLLLVQQYGLADSRVQIDPALARGLSYYTGAIFEVKANGVSIGSVSGGGVTII